jgi:tetrapyrrole methylase family protein/MazG family protein/ATP diphosphatase
MSVKPRTTSEFARIVAVMQRLLAPDGCPWDREQTLASLKRYAVEEAFEVCDAIDGLGDDAKRPITGSGEISRGPDDAGVGHLREELGDLLLQVVFQSELARAYGWFTIEHVVHDICEKLERRHPHVFGAEQVGGSAEVISNWEKIKLAEKKGRGTLEGIPRGMPALLYALRMGDKASRVGFDWPDAAGPRARVDEELAEFDAAVASGDREAMADELGDVLFSVVNTARKHGLDPEDSLTRCNRRFASRFAHVESLAKEDGRALDAHSEAELEAYWQRAKAEERARG